MKRAQKGLFQLTDSPLLLHKASKLCNPGQLVQSSIFCVWVVPFLQAGLESEKRRIECVSARRRPWQISGRLFCGHQGSSAPVVDNGRLKSGCSTLLESLDRGLLARATNERQWVMIACVCVCMFERSHAWEFVGVCVLELQPCWA